MPVEVRIGYDFIINGKSLWLQNQRTFNGYAKKNYSQTKSGSEPNPEVDDILAQCSNWNFPIFELKEKTPEVLSKIAYRIFDLSELFSHFRLPRGKFLSYFRRD